MVKLNIDLPESFFQEEERDGYLVSAKKKELWAVQLDILNEFDRVCRKHNLRYILDFGTLLGAVRHNGFIPWDIDIDVSMLRDDYEKLMEIGPSEFRYPYFLQNQDTDDNHYGVPISRLRRSDTCFFHGGNIIYHYQYNQGIFLDILPLDNLPSNDLNDIEPILKMSKQLLQRAVVVAHKPRIQMGYWYPVIMLKYMYYRLRCGNSNKQFKLLDSFAQSFEYSGYFGCLMTGYPICRPKQWYEESVDLPFETLSLRAPKAYDELLRTYYGDYMTPVVFENHVPYFSASRSYKDVMADKVLYQKLFNDVYSNDSFNIVVKTLWTGFKKKIHLPYCFDKTST